MFVTYDKFDLVIQLQREFRLAYQINPPDDKCIKR